MSSQPSLFSRGSIGFDPQLPGLQRLKVGPQAWVDYVPRWLSGEQQVLDALINQTEWQHQRRKMYDRVVAVPRLTARFPRDGAGHPIFARISAVLSERYGWALHSVSAAYYRDGRDSVAMHGDKMGPLKDDVVIAIVSLGGPRRFLLKPVDGGRSRAFSLGWGDLLVMGGTCQRTHLHGVPKVAFANPRVSIMFRPAVPSAVGATDAGRVVSGGLGAHHQLEPPKPATERHERPVRARANAHLGLFDAPRGASDLVHPQGVSGPGRNR